MKELCIEQMEMVKGGSTCGPAVGVAVLSASAIVGATLLAPVIWASPKTWYAAATLVGGNTLYYSENCLK